MYFFIYQLRNLFVNSTDSNFKQYWLKNLYGIEKEGCYIPSWKAKDLKRSFQQWGISEYVKEGAFGKVATARVFWSEL